MGICHEYSFKRYCCDNKIKGYFYQGKDNEPKKIYGKLKDVQELPLAGHNRLGTEYTANSVLESDFAIIETNKFQWYDDFLPKLEQIYRERERVLSGAWHSDGDNRELYQLDCAAAEGFKLGFELMTMMFSTHPILLKSAIGLCKHSLTTQHYNDYCETWKQYITDCKKKYEDSKVKHYYESDPEGLDVAWGKRVDGRPTILLSEPAIEVIVNKLVSEHETGQIGFHIDDFNSCYADDDNSPNDIPNYGYVSVILPGPKMDRDQVCTHISDEDDKFEKREWEQPGRGIWVPANVVHCGRTPAQGCSREVYLIEVLSNGNISSHNGENGHACKNVKSFRMTLSHLQAIQQRAAEGAARYSRAAADASAAVSTKANIYYI